MAHVLVHATTAIIALLVPGAGIAAAAISSGHAGLRPATASYFAPPPADGTPLHGARVVPRPHCKAHQIDSAGFTRASPDGVLGVVELKGTKFFDSRYHRHLRCALPFTHGPRALLAANGRRLNVPLGRADTVNPAVNPLSYLYLGQGRAAWGFGWFGSYCGAPPRYVVMKVDQHGGMLRVPLHGPTPTCAPSPSTSPESMLTDGPAGAPHSPVQPAPPSYLSLSTSAQFVGTATNDQPAPVEVTITDHTDHPVVLDPCPLYGLRTEVSAEGQPQVTSAWSDGRSPGCKHTALTVTKDQPVSFRVSRQALSWGWAHATAGKTFTVYVDLAGMPTAQASTTVQ